MGSETYHEPLELLSEHTRNLHRAIISLIEELEAVDWYQQRSEAASDGELKAVLTHHRNEEIEHAMMNLEWLIRNDPAFASNARTYLFSSGPIVEVEESATGGRDESGTSEGGAPGRSPPGSTSLGIGSLKGGADVDLLKRELAPILADAWAAIDNEAARVLRLNLAARKIVDVRGPYGWQFAAVNTGRLQILPELGDPDLNVGLRRVQPLVELRVPIKLALMELDSVARGAEDPDLSAVVRAAEKLARAEDNAIFNGLGSGDIAGIVRSSPHAPQPLPADLASLPRAVLAARETLRQAGVGGPYILVLGAALYDQVRATLQEGYPVAKQLEQLVDAPLVRAAAIDSAVVLSIRGGDYELWLGQDLSIGYAHHDKHEVELYLTESLTFRVLEPAAAVLLTKAR